jgi:hypothetical protein
MQSQNFYFQACKLNATCLGNDKSGLKKFESFTSIFCPTTFLFFCRTFLTELSILDAAEMQNGHHLLWHEEQF